MFGNRTDAMLEDAWSDVPQEWRSRHVYTDGWDAYSRFFPCGQHSVCAKGSGLTSRIEGWNTKWRQRQSGLVRRSCGVSHRIIDDIYERFLILVTQHNQQQKRQWEQRMATLSNP
jgi:IS1 family transposase